jgi:hypothetical protein
MTLKIILLGLLWNAALGTDCRFSASPAFDGVKLRGGRAKLKPIFPYLGKANGRVFLEGSILGVHGRRYLA